MSDTKVKVLLAEDDMNLGSMLREYLTVKGYDVDLCTDGEMAYKSFQENYYDICLLDVMMPLKDGFVLAKDIRELNKSVPFIFITAKAGQEDVLEGLRIGADDYLSKPFSMQELLLRVEAVLRRTHPLLSEDGDNVFHVGIFEFDSVKQILRKEGVEQKLTTKESELLRLLCLNKNDILERNYALKQVWKDDSYFNARSMDVYITKLRKHLKDDEGIQILNVHGKGYKLIIS
ncbi:MAG: hypothetical protein RIS47_1647 [Bacteroidota bacterium]|jgi:DNA-binding response OmpR family regulator